MAIPAIRDSGDVVVELVGEYDVADGGSLSGVLARAMAAGRGDVVVDLAGVTFMAVAPLRVLARASEFLRARSRTLVVLSPSPFVRRVIHLCGYSDVLDPTSHLQPAGAPALATWVDVPSSVPTAAATPSAPADASRTAVSSP